LNREALLNDYIGEEHTFESERVEDWLLVTRVAARDEAAFAELYGRYSVAIYNYLVHMIFDQVIAEDLLQEIFFSIWNAAGRFRGQSSVKTWIYRIAHHQTVSWLRRHRRELDQKWAGIQISENNPEEIFENASSYQALRDALGKLSTNHREVVELAFYHGLSYGEIAEVLGCPTGTVKSRMSYAKKRITGVLDAQDRPK
jgi:RNA polymerase sigma-70 factor (ECF subfamily)